MNGGKLPFLEMRSGQFITEAKIIVEFATEYARNKGLEVLSKDPIQAYKQRQKIEKCSALPPVFLLFFTWQGNHQDKNAIMMRDRILPAVDKWVK